MKKYMLLSMIAGIVMFLQSCATGYVGTRPNEIHVVRPANPSRTHIWIDRGPRTRTYVLRPGYSGQAKHKRTYVAGHWAFGPSGRYWVRGRWR